MVGRNPRFWQRRNVSGRNSKQGGPDHVPPTAFPVTAALYRSFASAPWFRNHRKPSTYVKWQFAYAEVMEQDGYNAHSYREEAARICSQPRMSRRVGERCHTRYSQQTRTEPDPHHGGQRCSPIQLTIQQLVISGENRRTRQNQRGRCEPIDRETEPCGISKARRFRRSRLLMETSHGRNRDFWNEHGRRGGQGLSRGPYRSPNCRLYR